MTTTISDARPIAPVRSPDQRMAALREANRIRVARSRVKGLIAEGVLLIADVVSNPMPELFSMKALDLLRAAPKLGPVKAARLLRQCAISNHKTVGGMSPRQRGELVRALMGANYEEATGGI